MDVAAADILLCSVPQELAQHLRTALDGAVRNVIDWAPDGELPSGARLIVADGVDAVRATATARCDRFVIVAADELAACEPALRPHDELVLAPARPEELVARLRLVLRRPSASERIRRRLLAMAVESTSDIIEITTPQPRFTFVNRAFEQTVGVPASEALGKSPASVMRSDAHDPAFFAEIDRTLHAGETWRGTIISRSRAGHLVHLESTISPISSDDGHITHHVAVKRDITERLQARQALEQSNRALEQARDAAVAANRAKSEFLANISHELRTPLNTIIGYSDMLLDEVVDEDLVRRDIKRIRRAGAHLLTLINDVLDISKIEADRIELTAERFAVTELLQSVADAVAMMAKENHNELVVECDGELGEMTGDQTRVRQVLLNLLSNACKFTHDGRVTLSARVLTGGADERIELRVQDTGIGIPTGAQARLFEPFVQVDATTTRTFGGTGLGLAISKRLLDLMGGTIELDSELGAGTTFTVVLPRDTDVGAPRIESMPAGHAPLILLIDDDPDVREMFVRVLSRRGFRVQLASSGQQGIERARDLEPDAIVLDVKMPGMTGWDVLSTLKLSARTAHIPVIMLTVLHQQEIGRALGAIDYLVKPISPDMLVAALDRNVRRGTARVLVVEDDEPTRELVRRTLEAAGHTVFEADNGRVALDGIAGTDPDIIVLDLMMPVMDGFTFLHHLRNHDEYSTVPVIVATARTLSQAERSELALLAQQVIEKQGHTRAELIRMISEQIGALFDYGRSADPDRSPS